MPKNVEILIIKLLNKSITKSEWDQLNLWINEDENKQLLYQYMDIDYVIDDLMKEFNTERTKKTLLLKIRKDKRSSFRYTILKYAAIFVVAISTIYLLVDMTASDTFLNTSPVVETTKIEHGTDKAILTLGDGSQIKLSKGEQFETQKLNSNGEEITYEKAGKDSKTLVYNYITIPKGGQFRIVLSDGTRVWLNSDSQLKYPESFLDNETREVELVYGEAYFDVSSNSNHNGSQFKVINTFQDIEVSGTEFNMKAYKDETVVVTTLVEGEIAVTSEGTNQVLKPSEQSILYTKSNKMNVELVDVYDEISWKDGVFIFEKMPLKEIVKVLSRWYDIDFIFENENIEKNRFTGSLKRNLKIDEILKAIKNFNKIKDYKVRDRTIIIK